MKWRTSGGDTWSAGPPITTSGFRKGLPIFPPACSWTPRRRSPDKAEQFWERGRKMILEKNEFGRSANDAGPLWMGIRLDTYKTGSAYRKLVYPKGGYILHMLRGLMWDPQTHDDDFIALMHDFVKTNSGPQRVQ